MFTEKMEVQYRNLFGIIGFVCEHYIVLNLPAAKNRDSAKVLIFPENYHEVICLKDSFK
jgi:hypothetical protein